MGLGPAEIDSILYSAGIASVAAVVVGGLGVGTEEAAQALLAYGAPVGLGEALALKYYPWHTKQGAGEKRWIRCLVAGGIQLGVLALAGQVTVGLDVQTASALALGAGSVYVGEMLALGGGGGGGGGDALY